MAAHRGIRSAGTGKMIGQISKWDRSAVTDSPRRGENEG